MKKCKHDEGFTCWNGDFGYYKKCNKCGEEFSSAAPFGELGSCVWIFFGLSIFVAIATRIVLEVIH
jgi:hypothetical protein